MRKTVFIDEIGCRIGEILIVSNIALLFGLGSQNRASLRPGNLALRYSDNQPLLTITPEHGKE